jgi:hypothetical protein
VRRLALALRRRVYRALGIVSPSDAYLTVLSQPWPGCELCGGSGRVAGFRCRWCRP